MAPAQLLDDRLQLLRPVEVPDDEPDGGHQRVLLRLQVGREEPAEGRVERDELHEVRLPEGPRLLRRSVLPGEDERKQEDREETASHRGELTPPSGPAPGSSRRPANRDGVAFSLTAPVRSVDWQR